MNTWKLLTKISPSVHIYFYLSKIKRVIKNKYNLDKTVVVKSYLASSIELMNYVAEILLTGSIWI